MLKRLVHWLLGIPPAERLEAHERHQRTRDRQRTDAIRESDRSNLGGPPGGGLSGSSGSFG